MSPSGAGALLRWRCATSHAKGMPGIGTETESRRCVDGCKKCIDPCGNCG